MLNGYSDWLEEEGFGTSFAVDIADFVTKIFEELDSMWTKRPQSLGSYGDEMEIPEVSIIVDFSKFGFFCSEVLYQYIKIYSYWIADQSERRILTFWIFFTHLYDEMRKADF